MYLPMFRQDPPNSQPSPYAPWDWITYLHLAECMVEVGEYTSPMEHLGKKNIPSFPSHDHQENQASLTNHSGMLLSNLATSPQLSQWMSTYFDCIHSQRWLLLRIMIILGVAKDCKLNDIATCSVPQLLCFHSIFTAPLQVSWPSQ